MKAVSKLIVLTALVTLVACSKENNPKDENDDNKANPVLTVKLVDAPSVYDAVNVEILYMKARFDSNWIDLPVEIPGVYNLQEFINGNSMLLIGDTSLAPGVITELRLVLGNNNSVIVDGESYELQTPSGQSSGYKIKMDPQPLVPGGIYSLVVDFDVSESVHRTGGGKYMLKPVVRGYLEDAIGGISGTIFPFTESFFVEAVNLTDTAGTLTDPLTGEFLIGTVLPGTYNVTIYASPSFSDTTITGVIVSAGQITQIDTVFLQ
jgi:hypothetical protein